MKKAISLVAIVLLMSIVSHMTYDTVAQLRLINSGANTEYAGKFLSSKLMRVNLNHYINHTHDFVNLKICNFMIGVAEVIFQDPILISNSPLLLPSAFWHPPQS